MLIPSLAGVGLGGKLRPRIYTGRNTLPSNSQRNTTVEKRFQKKPHKVVEVRENSPQRKTLYAAKEERQLLKRYAIKPS